MPPLGEFRGPPPAAIPVQRSRFDPEFRRPGGAPPVPDGGG